jgi:hypothetical protein
VLLDLAERAVSAVGLVAYICGHGTEPATHKELQSCAVSEVLLSECNGVLTEMLSVGGCVIRWAGSSRSRVDRCTTTADLEAGCQRASGLERGTEGRAPSCRRYFRQSTKRPKWGEEARANSGIRDVGHNESPREVLT